jgi:hypothetical protein
VTLAFPGLDCQAGDEALLAQAARYQAARNRRAVEGQVGQIVASGSPAAALAMLRLLSDAQRLEALGAAVVYEVPEAPAGGEPGPYGQPG